MPYQELPHTADWALHIWAADLPALFAECALGMNWLAGAALSPHGRITRTFETVGSDNESLLVAFLSELVYYAEQENLGFDQFEIETKNDRLKVKMHGAPLAQLGKAIKAVTWHGLEINQSVRGVEVQIVFDV